MKACLIICEVNYSLTITCFFLAYIYSSFNKEKLDKIPNHDFLYYFWFSLITQTTVGYANMLPNSLNSQNEEEIFKLSKYINIIQLISIFILAAYM